MSEVIRFESRRVGRIEVPASDVVTFEPLPGFPGKSRYVLMEHAPDSALAWLVSLAWPARPRWLHLFSNFQTFNLSACWRLKV